MIPHCSGVHCALTQQVPLLRHTCPGAHVPQFCVPPHPSESVPHCLPAQALGVQHEEPVQIWPAGQSPQETYPLQPS